MSISEGQPSAGSAAAGNGEGDALLETHVHIDGGHAAIGRLRIDIAHARFAFGLRH